MEAIDAIAVVSDYASLLTALRRRVIDLNTNLAAVDAVAGLPSNYTTKVLNGTKRFGPMSPTAVIGALA
jgi:hypothetical protein